MAEVKQQSYQQVRLGSDQKKRLEAMATVSGISQTELLNHLVDLAAEHGIKVDTEIKINLIIDDEFKRRIMQYPTVAEVERMNG